MSAEPFNHCNCNFAQRKQQESSTNVRRIFYRSIEDIWHAYQFPALIFLEDGDVRKNSQSVKLLLITIDPAESQSTGCECVYIP